MKKWFFILLLSFTACVPNFDPEKDSDWGYIYIDVNASAALARDAAIWEENCRPRISAYCMKNDTLICSAKAYPEHIWDNTELRVGILPKEKEYELVVIADYEQATDYGRYVPRWFHVRTDKPSRFHLERFERGYLSTYDAIAIYYSKFEPRTQPYPLLLAPLGCPCHVTLTNTSALRDLDFELTFNGLYSFSPMAESTYKSVNRAYPLLPGADVIDSEIFERNILLIPGSDGKILLNYKLGRSTKIKDKELTLEDGKSYKLDIDLKSGAVTLAEDI